MGSCILYLLQAGGFRYPETPKRQRLTRSLLSGSEKSMSSRSESEGGSCDTAPYSKPCLLQSAADAASAAIDYSKGNVEDGVVDSPPSRGPVRTPVCSPSPLKRASSSRGYSLSPPPREDMGTSRRLHLPLEELPTHPRVDDKPTGSAPPTLDIDKLKSLATHDIGGSKSIALLGEKTRIVLPRSTTNVSVIPLQDKPPRPSHSAGPKLSPIDHSLSNERVTREPRRSLRSKSTSTEQPFLDIVPASLSRRPLQGSKSLSVSEAQLTPRRSKRRDSGAKTVSEQFNIGRGSVWPARREQILRGYAKFKAEEEARIAKLEAQEAARINCSKMDK
jgi:hypothetical protein